MVSGAIVNTILDPVFIFGFNWGVFGAALATILGQFLSFFMAVRYLWKFNHIHFTRKHLRVNLRDSLITMYMGTSSCVNQLAITVVQIVLNNSLTYYGALSVYGEDIPLAACGIVMKTNAILLSIIVGISQGVQPIISFNFGAGKYDRVKKAYLLAISWNAVVSIIGFCAFQFFPQQIISLFGNGTSWYFEFAVLFYADIFVYGYCQWCTTVVFQLLHCNWKGSERVVFVHDPSGIFPDSADFDSTTETRYLWCFACRADCGFYSVCRFHFVGQKEFRLLSQAEKKMVAEQKDSA